MTILSTLKKWYFNTFLPFENPDHPLHTPMYEDIDDEDLCPYTGSPGSFYKAPKWEKWGDKWYKKY